MPDNSIAAMLDVAEPTFVGDHQLKPKGALEIVVLRVTGTRNNLTSIDARVAYHGRRYHG